MHVPQLIVPPQPSGAMPQFWPAGHCVAGMQRPHTLGVPPPPQVSGAAQLPQLIKPPQPSEMLPQFFPSAMHVVRVQGGAAHVPLVQTSPTVFGLPSSHAVPLALVGFEHIPVAGLHVPATWH